MAPPTGPRGATSTTTRTTRSSTAPSRGSSRGGIAKRGRPPAPRVDRDGDLVMDAGSKSGAGINKPKSSTRRGNARVSGPPRSSGPPRPSGPAKMTTRLQQNLVKQIGGDTSRIPSGPSAARMAANNTTLKVLGLKESKAATNRDGGVKSLVEFLERKASLLKGPGRPVMIKKSLPKGDFVYIMASNQDAEELLKVNGFSFAGSSLTIARCEEGWPTRTDQTESRHLSNKTQEDMAKLQQVLERRYDPNMKLLNLSALGKDKTLIEMGIFKGAEDTAEKTFKVFMVICQDLFKTPQAKREAIESVSLAGNNIDSVDQVFDLAETFPDLKHLDISDNHFSSLKQLNKWRGRFRHLETLLLSNNPIIQTEPGHATEVLEWFPKLQNLSNIQVRTPEQIAAAEAAAAVKDLPQRGTDFRDVAGLGEQFIRQFFSLYDSDRDQLLATFYDEYSTFTLAVANSVPHDKDTAMLPWQPYLGFSRNHQRITTEAARFQRYLKGIRIQELWRKLPATKHPDLATNLDKYIIDCHPMKGLHDPVNRKIEGEDGMIITMHGEFDEHQADTGKTGKRSFSRTFVLGPSLPGRGVMRVISDMLTLHSYSPAPTVVSVMDAASSAVAPNVAASPQELMLVELSKRTNMTAEYCKMCLETAQWDFDRALAAFEESKSALPPQAFLQA